MSDVLKLHIRSFVRDGVQILQGIEWCVSRGEHWAVLGANGAGKSSLLAAVAGYEWHCQGTIAALGQTYGQCDMRALRGRVGLVSSRLFEWLPDHQQARRVVASGLSASVGDWYVPTQEDLAHADDALGRVGAHTYRNKKYGVLSQGEKQRVMIARALVTEPELLILDEPCAGLDPGARERLIRDVDQLCTQAEGPTLIMSSHHIEEIPPHGTHGLLLKGGNLLAAGVLSEVLTDAKMTELYDYPGRVVTDGDRYWWRGGARTA